MLVDTFFGWWILSLAGGYSIWLVDTLFGWWILYLAGGYFIWLVDTLFGWWILYLGVLHMGASHGSAAGVI
jgi:hypothetical protein